MNKLSALLFALLPSAGALPCQAVTQQVFGAIGRDWSDLHG